MRIFDRYALATALVMPLTFVGAGTVPALAQDQIEREQLPPLETENGDIIQILPDPDQGEPDQQQAEPDQTAPNDELPPLQEGQAQDDTPSIEDIEPTPEKKETRLKNPVAEFAGLDKITGRIISFDVYINETVQFGALQVTPKVCYSRPDAEEPKTDTFVEVDEITLDRKIRRIFTGWMFAESPGISAVEHPVYDVWLKSCKQKSDIPPPETAKTN